MGQWGGTIIYIVIFAGIFYFMLIRPQSKQKKERDNMMSGLSVNDRICTIGGILGVITMIKEETVWIRVSDKTEIQIRKSAIQSIVGEDN